MVNFMVFMLREDVRSHKFFPAFYPPVLGFIMMLMLNQVVTELRQMKNSESYWQYFTNLWNLNDLIYLIANITVIVMNYLGKAYDIGNI